MLRSNHATPVRSASAPARAVLAAALLAALAGCSIPGLPSHQRLEANDISLRRMTLPPRPPEIIAKSAADIDRATRAAAPERLAEQRLRDSAEGVEGPQLPFFFESAIGRAYLRSGPGRAIARGAPEESCPIAGAALERASIEDAERAALSECLGQGRALSLTGCGCQLLAAADVLLAPRERFAYARAVSARAILYEGGRTSDSALFAEERFDHDRDAETLDDAALRAFSAGARSLWLLDAAGPVASLDLHEDGAAELRPMTGERDALRPNGLFVGRWRAEGFRRGRRALQAALVDAKGRRMAVLLGYEPNEPPERRAAALTAATKLFDHPAPLTPPDPARQ